MRGGIPMDGLRIKQYAIHILPTSAIRVDTFDLPQRQNAIIICNGQSNQDISLCLPYNTLVMDFPDIEDPRHIGAFNAAHARKIIGFVRSLSFDVTDIYVCCSKGSSRSPAVAAALLRMSGRSDKAVWMNPFYVPNLLVYYGLFHTWGFHTTRFSVWCRHLANVRAFKRAQRRKKTEYERWEILF